MKRAAAACPVHAMNERPLVSIITVFWNGEALVPRFVAAIEQCARAVPFGIEVLAVDNASADDTAALLESAHPTIRLLRQHANGGFAAGCNAGLREARGRFLLLLNPDAEINPRALAAMLHALRRRRDIGAVGCEIVDERGRARPAAHDEPSGESYWATHSLFSKRAVVEAKRRGEALSLRRCDWLMGSCIMTRHDVVERVGPLDELYFLYSEDTAKPVGPSRWTERRSRIAPSRQGTAGNRHDRHTRKRDQPRTVRLVPRPRRFRAAALVGWQALDRPP